MVVRSIPKAHRHAAVSCHKAALCCIAAVGAQHANSAKVLMALEKSCFGRSSPNIGVLSDHTEIIIGFDGMEFLCGVTILLTHMKKCESM